MLREDVNFNVKGGRESGGFGKGRRVIVVG